MSKVREDIVARLTAAFRPVSLDVDDESHLHQGHAGWREGGETHFRVAIRAAAFNGKSRIDRHRMVNAALDELIGNPIHALAIKAEAAD